MKKSEAKNLFGSVSALCRALGISRAAYYKWDDPLPQKKEDQVRGAYMRYCEEKDREAVAVFGRVK